MAPGATPLATWVVPRLRTSLAFAELGARKGRAPSLESTWLNLGKAYCRFRVFLCVGADEYGAVEVDLDGDPQGALALDCASSASTFELQVGRRKFSGEGVGRIWGSGPLYESAEALLAEGDELRIRLEVRPAGIVRDKGDFVEWELPFGRPELVAARPGSCLVSRAFCLGGSMVRARLILKRKRHAGVTRVEVSEMPVPVRVRCGQRVGRGRRHFDFEDLADVFLQTGDLGPGAPLRLCFEALPREPEGWLTRQTDGLVEWTLGVGKVMSEYVVSAPFPLHKGTAYFVLYPQGGQAPQLEEPPLTALEESDDSDAESDSSEEPPPGEFPWGRVYVRVVRGHGGPWALRCSRSWRDGVSEQTSSGELLPGQHSFGMNVELRDVLHFTLKG